MRHLNVPILIRGAAILIAALIFPWDRPACLHAQAIEQVAAAVENRIAVLKVDLHEPDPRGESMQAATLEARGWHHQNAAGPVALRAGTRVEVTGLFNYSERGLFLELAREEPGASRGSVTERPRVRIRIMVETPGTDPEKQRAAAMTLIGKVIDFAPAP